VSSPPAAPPARRVHVLKSVVRSFAAVWDGSKRHEVRQFDRGYVVGDVVLLMEFSPARPTGAPAGPLGWWGPRVILGTITNLTGPQSFGLPPSLCVFTLGSLVLLHGHDEHDDTRPPRASPLAAATLPADILAAWQHYNPRDLHVVPAPAPAPAAAAAPPRKRRPARKKTPAPVKKGARRR
jgi:hypothetical protein